LKIKHIGLLLSVVFVFLLAGCGSVEPITAQSEGIWNHYFVYPLSYVLTYVASFFNGNYGLSIIIVTLVIRFVLLPLNLHAMKSSQALQHIKPEMDKLREKYPLSSDRETQMKFQQELMQLYAKHKVNPMAGCMPMLLQLFVQFPILMAFYYAIRRTEEIAGHTFLWFDLGASDPFIILPIIAALSTYLQLRMTQQTMPPQMKMLVFVMPIMIFIGALAMPSALALYWVIGNLFAIGQTYYLQVQRNKAIPLEI